MSSQPEVIDLPEARLLLWENFMARERGDKLFALWRNSLDWQQTTIRIAGVERQIPRLNSWYGEHAYRYSGAAFAARPFPAELEAFRREVEERTGYCFNAALVNLYRTGQDSVAWHSDDEPELGKNPAIASFSLGATRVFRIRHKKTRQTLELPLQAGMLLLMTGAMQHHWQHCVPKTRRVTTERLNITWRYLYNQ